MIFGELSLEEFKKQCPLNIVENPMYIKKSLEEAIKAKDENDFERLHTIVWVFKLYNINAYIELFCKVAKEYWHHSHEDIANLLEEVASPKTINAIYDLAIMKLDYMEYDEFFNIARKCTYALGYINTPKAKEKLELLAQNENELIREYAIKQLNRHDFTDKDVEEQD